MTLAEIEAYLHRQIPISAAMGVRVVACDVSGVTLSAPLALNLNHHATAFGGSISAVAILAAWTWLHVTLDAAAVPTRLVIQRNSIDYLTPITADFEAHCGGPTPEAMAKFFRSFGRHGKARIELSATLRCGADKVATFSGEYVALRTEPAVSA